VKSRLRRTLAALLLTAAALTAATAADTLLAPAGDTTWGAPDTPTDTTWNTPATPDTGASDDAPATVVPLDTTW